MPVEILGLHHYTLRTRDLKRATAFYESVFGLKRKPQPGMATRSARYDLGDWELQLLETDDLPDRADAPDPRESHPAIEVDNIHNAVAACLSGGAEMQQVTFVRDEDGSQSAFLRDPDGNLLELCSHPGRFSRRAFLPAANPAANGAGVANRPVVMASAPSVPSLAEETFPHNAENFFSNRNQKRENGRLILTLLVAALLLGAGVALRYTIFAPKYSADPIAKPIPSANQATGDKQSATGNPSAATPTLATPAPTPTPSSEPITPSLSDTNGVPAPPEPKKQ